MSRKTSRPLDTSNQHVDGLLDKHDSHPRRWGKRPSLYLNGRERKELQLTKSILNTQDTRVEGLAWKRLVRIGEVLEYYQGIEEKRSKGW